MNDEWTVFQALLHALDKAREYNPADQVAPAAILWPDKGGEWLELLPRLRAELPQLLTLGQYAPEAKTGPAIWLRCMIARTLPEADWPEDATPIIYLPGVSRRELRAVEDCPKPLRPLAELQHRGVLFSQVSARDWTILAFLVSDDGGLGLEVAQDKATIEAMRRALRVLADTQIAALRGKKLHAGDFDELVTPDETRSLLMWLSNPDALRAMLDENQWGSFTARCRSKYGFDPEADGPMVAAERLGAQEGNWAHVWRRYAEAPASYPGIPELLRQARPTVTDSLFFDRSAWPQDNEEMEDELRAALAALGDASPADARAAIRDLEAKHGERRGWVWAKLSQAPLARALEPLATLARVTATALGGATPHAIAEHYADGLWQADAAVLDALAAVERNADAQAVERAISTLYKPWLEAAAQQFQQAVDREGLPAPDTLEPPDGTCIVFADGLRYDVAEKLAEALAAAGAEPAIGWDFAALPTVTPTSKPAASPVADLFAGDDTGEDFQPHLKADGKDLTAERFRQALASRGYAVLAEDETGAPSGSAWTEYGSLDRRGHDEGAKLARRIDEEVRGLALRVQELLEAGWREVRIVTDHGWLLLPGGLPKVELPHYLAETRWGRCAVLKPTSKTEMLTVPWRWNPQVRIAPAPGIGCVVAGREFAHGGLSVQECVVPMLTVKGAEPGVEVTIEGVRWVGFRCYVEVAGGASLTADLRTKVADAASSIAKGGRDVDEDGSAALVVEDDRLEGTAVNVVVLDADGNVLVRRATTVGGDGDAA